MQWPGVQRTAACDGNARVVLRHAGLATTERMQRDGTLRVRVPDLQLPVRVKISFGDGRSVMTGLNMPKVMRVIRFPVQWTGVEGVVLHDFEEGAGPRQSVNISPSQSRMLPHRADSRWLSLLGEDGVPPLPLAQVCTDPTDGSLAEVAVQAPVTAKTCDQNLLGRAARGEAGAVEGTELTVAMPDCSALGDVLVLNNIAQDTKVTSR